MTTQPDDDLKDAVVQASSWFDEICQQLHNREEDPLGFLGDNNLGNALTALAMAANAIRYQFVELVITHSLLEQLEEPELGGSSFKRSGKEWGNVRNEGEWKQGSESV